MQKKCTHKVYQGKILYTSKIVQKNEKKKKNKHISGVIQKLNIKKANLQVSCQPAIKMLQH